MQRLVDPASVSTSTGPGGASAPPYLSVKGLTKRFGQSTVVDAVSFDVEPGAFLCVLGPSGCGKTTLLRLIAGFERADAGDIVQAGRTITRLSPEQRDFGIVFQSYALFPNRTAAGNVAYGLEATGVPRRAREARAAELLDLVGLLAHAGKYPSQLSGGQQQRVALARALALSPGLLLLDEPLSALDAKVRARLRDELRDLQRRLGVTSLMVTHDQQEALSIADRILVMNHGRIEQAGTPAELYESPASLFVARFLGDMNALEVQSLSGDRVTAGGLTLGLENVVAPASIDRGASMRTRLCIRPAAVAVGAEADGQSNLCRGTIVQVEFLGDTVRIRLAPDGAPGLLIQADTPRLRLDRLPTVGEPIAFALPPRHLRLLPDDE